MSVTSSGETASARASTSSACVRRCGPDDGIRVPQVNDRPHRRQRARRPQVRDLAAARGTRRRRRRGSRGPVDDLGDLGAGVAELAGTSTPPAYDTASAETYPVEAVGRPHHTRSPGRSPSATYPPAILRTPSSNPRYDRPSRPRRTPRGRRTLRRGAEDGGQRRVETQHVLGRLPPVDLTDSPEARAFRAEVRGWLEDNLGGDFADLQGLGGAGQDHEAHDERLEWNRHLARHRWTCIGWPTVHGGRGLGLTQQVIFHEEYARANAPARGQPPRRGAARTHPDRVRHRRAAGLGSCRRSSRSRSCGARATPSPAPGPTSPTCRPRVGWRTPWVIDGQKVWTSTGPLLRLVLRARPHRARVDAPPRALLPARALDRTASRCVPSSSSPVASEFNEVFFTGARTDADLVVGEPGQGWGVAMGLLGFERGVSSAGPDGRVPLGSWTGWSTWPGPTGATTTRWCATGSPAPTSSWR